MLLAASAATANDEPPAIIDERRPTLSPPIEDALERGPQSVDVELPGTLDRLDAETRVPVSGVRIQGGSIFDLETLSDSLQPLVGQRVAVNRLVEAVETITRRYQDAGYPLSYAYLPSNNFHEGLVTVVVVEGYIARTEIAVEDAAVARRVERLAARMRQERPLSRETFERYTALIERIPGARLAVRAPVPRTPSGATTLRVEQRDSDRIDAGLTLGGGDKDDSQVIGNLALHSHTPYAETLSLAYLMPVDNDDTFHAAQYRQELGTDGLRLNMSAQRFEGDEEDPALVEGRPYEVTKKKERDRYRLGLDYPLLLERRRRWNLEANVEHLDETADYRYRSDLGPELQGRQELRYSTLELGTHYRQGNADRRLEASAELRQGIDLGANRTTTEIRNVANGASLAADGQEELEYTRFGLQGRWLEALTPNWRLSMRVAGFWSEDALPAPERGTYGGGRFARAYDDGEAKGERGYAGEIELRYRQALGASWASHLEPYLAMDGAHTEFNDSDLEYDLASVASGVELSHGARYRLGIEYAYPLGDRPVEDASREGRINARLSWDFGG